MSTKMNLFQALEWMCSQDGHPLVGVQAPYQVPFKAKMLDGELQYCSIDSEIWSEWTPNWVSASKYSFRVPERKLPKLPKPYVWGYDVQNELCVKYLNGDFRTYPFASQTACDERKRENELHAALIEEFETRPK